MTHAEADAKELALVEPSPELEDAFNAMAVDFLEAGEINPRRRPAQGYDFHAFLEELGRQDRGIGLSAGQVPQSTFWLARSDGALLGTARLRHWLTPELEVWGGHIGYEIRPSERRQGYGTKLLALMLPKARARGLRSVLLTCYDDNVGSTRVIEKNGAGLVDRVALPDSRRLARRYWICLDPKGANRAC